MAFEQRPEGARENHVDGSFSEEHLRKRTANAEALEVESAC